MNVNGATLTNSGTISSSKAGGTIALQSTGALTVAGTGQCHGIWRAVALPLRCKRRVLMLLPLPALKHSMQELQALLNLNAQVTGASISIAAGSTETMAAAGGALTISTPSLQCLAPLAVHRILALTMLLQSY